MANSIRTPKQGTNATSRRIAEAVDNEGWQFFRVGLKGKSTENKLKMLAMYMETHWAWDKPDSDEYIRVDNYLKALARGGQIEAVMNSRYIERLDNGHLTVRK